MTFNNFYRARSQTHFRNKEVPWTLHNPSLFLLKKRENNLIIFKFQSFQQRGQFYAKEDYFTVIEISLPKENTSQNSQKLGFVVFYVASTGGYSLHKKIKKQFKQLIQENIKFKLKQYSQAFEESLFQLNILLNSAEFALNNKLRDMIGCYCLRKLDFKAVLFIDGQLIISKSLRERKVYPNFQLQINVQTFAGTYNLEKDESYSLILQRRKVEQLKKQQGGYEEQEKEEKEQEKYNQDQCKLLEEKYVKVIDSQISLNIKKLIISNLLFDVKMFDDSYEQQYPKVSNILGIHYFKITFLKSECSEEKLDN